LAQESSTAPPELKVTFLVNEGFLVEVDGKSILLDAFVRDEYYGYGALPESTYQQLIRGEPPFDVVTLAFTSHVHLDHFQVEPAVLFLQTHPKTLFVSAEEVVLAVRHAESNPPVGNQTQVLWPEAGKFQSFEHNGIRVTGFRLRHTNPRNATVQNLGMLANVGETTILHVGDADATQENFAPYDLPAQQIDVAILPVWMFSDRKLIDDQIGAKTYIAAHIPTAELANTKQEFAQTHPDVIVFERPLETWPPDGASNER
jgi:L-ascorbate metabolism protein UlaG (beta-lactamase superfamily)